MVIHSTNSRGGFAMVEAAVSSIIVGVMIVAALRTVGAAAKSRAAIVEQRTGWMLANDLLAEVLKHSYKEPVDTPAFGRESSESGGNKKDYDDVDDYDDWVEKPPVDKGDITIPGFPGWQRRVKVRYIDPITMVESGSVVDTGLKQITVTVTGPAGKTTVVRSLRGKSGGFETPPSSDVTSVEWIGMRLQIGHSKQPMITGVDMLNRPPQ